ncbi:MAG: class E sortase [Candidatus Staskawiczbacteria bacterium]|nr:class E sortase [Candidatus Staskawiczbacteria bacterium]
MDKKQAKNLLKITVIIYVASFLIFNWSTVSWLFNYKEVYGMVNAFFNPYPTIDASSMEAYFYPNHSQTASTTTAIKKVKTTYTDKQNTLEIPKISIEAPIVFPTSSDYDLVTKKLDSGVVYYPGSVYPGQKGEIVILGHSAPVGWPKVKYDWVFNDLDKLALGDEILVDLNNKQYKYIVKSKTIVKKGADVPTDNLSAEKNVLILISCWPPGKDYQRIIVYAELEDA